MNNKRSRGYVLLESMIGAAVLGGALLAAYTNITDARVRSIATTRQQMATEVAMRCIELARARSSNADFTGINECDVRTGAPSTVTRSTTSFLGATNATRDGINFVSRLYIGSEQAETVTTSEPLPLHYRQITAVVWYPNPRKAGEYIPFSISTRIYDRR
jgi:type II secretory pathway pseudopilin PulG